MENLDFTDLLSKDPKIKYPFAKKLLAFARENPAEIYPNLDFFIELLDNENKIIKWTAIDIIEILARVDRAKKIDKLMSKIFGLLSAGNLITANHAIAALTDIAMSKPEHRTEITNALLGVEHCDYDTDECRNIAIGKVILAISMYFDELDDKETTIECVRRQTKNTRNATRKKAEQFLRKYNDKIEVKLVS